MTEKDGWYVPVLMAFSTLALLWIPGLFAMATAHVPNATYDIVLVVLLVLSTITYVASHRTARNELFLWCIGATMVVTIVPYAAYDGQMWEVWGLFFPFLAAAFLNERAIFALHLPSDQLFNEEEEARSFRSLMVSGLRGTAFILAVMIVSAMIAVVIPWLSIGSAPLWLLGSLSIVVLLSLAYVAANRP